MSPLISAAKYYRFVVVEFGSGDNPSTINPWVGPRINKNMKNLTLKLENFIYSVLM